MVSKLTRAAGTATSPEQYGTLAAHAFLPDVIPFDPTLPASFGFAGINGRGLRDDFGSVVYSTVFNFPMRTAIPALTDFRNEWSYVAPARPLPSAGGGVAVPSRNQ